VKLAPRAWLLALAAGAPLAAAADEPKQPFELREIASPDRAVQADLADLDGDGRGDLIWISTRGLPPQEERELRVHLGGADGLPAPHFSWRAALPPGVAAYDLAELDGRPGSEMLFLRRDRITVFSLTGGEPHFRDLPVPGEPTLAAVQDERGVDRLRIVHDGLGPGPRLLVPGFGVTRLLDPGGALVARMDVGGRANFLVPPRPGPMISESEMEIYFDHPRLGIGDVDGDGRGDLVASLRHELRVFRQRADGGFPGEPDFEQPLGRLSLQDHIRTSGSVRVEAHHFDADGRLDLLVAASSGSVLGGDTRIAIHKNKGGRWDLAKEDQLFESKGGIATHEVVDLDGDGRAELVVALVPTGVLELVELLLTRKIDAEVSVYRPAVATPFEPKPWRSWKLSVKFDFDTLRTKGFIPTLAADVNGDGLRDLVEPGEGERLEVRLGDREQGFGTRHAEQQLDTRGRIRFGDLEGDGLADFVIYDPRRPGAPIRVAHNRGGWPAVEPELRPATEASVR
jgi:hypothetical protein